VERNKKAQSSTQDSSIFLTSTVSTEESACRDFMDGAAKFAVGGFRRAAVTFLPYKTLGGIMPMPNQADEQANKEN